ncbi:MAG TPA: hypothetical protein VGG50_01910 [Streptosporangiaceae bacterium]|jgi:hypothetical protein
MRLQPVRVISIAASALLPAVSMAACGSGGNPPPSATPSAGHGASVGTASSGTPGAASARPASPTSAGTRSSGTRASSGTPASSGGTGPAATAQIKADWQEFFSVKTPVATRISLLQNGSAFASILRSQASSPLAASAASSVSAVKVESPAQASVTYSILLHGTPALKNEPGVAVHQDGTWKVGDQSFCALLILESSGKAPAACASAAG